MKIIGMYRLKPKPAAEGVQEWRDKSKAWKFLGTMTVEEATIFNSNKPANKYKTVQMDSANNITAAQMETLIGQSELSEAMEGLTPEQIAIFQNNGLVIP